MPESNNAFSIHGGEVDIFSGHHQLDTLEGHKRHQRISIHNTPLSLKSQHANGKATTPHSAFLLSPVLDTAFSKRLEYISDGSNRHRSLS